MSTDIGLYDEALSTFFAEAKDMLRQMEDALLSLEDDPCDSETINALFRAVHTIKGSAGLFDLDQVVAFTHQVESVLDRVRAGNLGMDAALGDVLLKSADVIALMLNQLENKNEDAHLPAQLDTDSAALAVKLAGYLADDVKALPSQLDDIPVKAKMGTWHISLRFGANAFRNGFDPVSTIHYLRTIGEITAIVTIDDNLPDLNSPGSDAYDPETCYLGFEIRLFTSAPQSGIDAAFEYVRDDCTVRLFPPSGPEIDFVALIHELPEEPRLGDILVECGAVSRQTVERALLEQLELSHTAGGEQKLAIGELLVAHNNVTPEVVDAALIKQAKIRDNGVDGTVRFVRVPADKLDNLINLVGEMVICGASAGLQAQQLQDPILIETTQQMSRLVEEIRNGSLSLRMVHIGETFGRYRRVVRDIAGELGKQVELEIEGAETELDKSVVEKIGDPLMHLVRNALDHGIELPEQRIAAGKSAVATVRLSAHHDSGHIVIRVTDDGRGIDGDKLVVKARERGLVQANHLLNEQEKLDLIFTPGFSTAEVVTNLSGRGVGMDVVRKNIEALRGSILLKSTIGAGTTIEIRLPLTLAIIDGFLVKVGRNTYVIPLQAIAECIDANDDNMHSHSGLAGNLDLRGDVLPFLELRKIFSVKGEKPKRRSIVVVKNGEAPAGLVVDQLLGEYQTVIKPLGKLFRNLRGISGSTVLGSGEVALILDVPALVKLAMERELQADGSAAGA